MLSKFRITKLLTIIASLVGVAIVSIALAWPEAGAWTTTEVVAIEPGLDAPIDEPAPVVEAVEEPAPVIVRRVVVVRRYQDGESDGSEGSLPAEAVAAAAPTAVAPKPAAAAPAPAAAAAPVAAAPPPRTTTAPATTTTTTRTTTTTTTTTRTRAS